MDSETKRVMDQGQLEFAAAGIDDIHRVIGDARLEVTVVAIEHLDALLIFLELGRIVSLREQILEKDGLGNADRPQIFHGALDR